MRPDESFVSQPVRSLQTMLRVIAQDNNRLPSVIPDGIYGPQTRAAVSAFQRSYGLPVTGVADQLTWDRIVDVHEPADVRVGPAQPLQLILNPNQVLQKGEDHPYLYLIQVMLNALSNIHSSIPAPAITGILDEPTADALEAFQHLSGLPQTGEVDKITWKHLALQYPLAVNLQESVNRVRRS